MTKIKYKSQHTNAKFRMIGIINDKQLATPQKRMNIFELIMTEII